MSPLRFLTRLLFSFVCLAWSSAATAEERPSRLPWPKAGLTERQAAAHLLNRLTYGPTPGEVDRMVEIGLANWLEGQLLGDLPGSVTESKLAELSSVRLSSTEIQAHYSPKQSVYRAAVAAGVVSSSDFNGDRGEARRRQAAADLRSFAEEHGYRSLDALVGELRSQKVYRGRYSDTQLVEVLTDFWFNHFNVSVTNKSSKGHVLSYERDAIRPRVLGTFRELLGAVARHPAMLLYLGNAESVAPPAAVTRFDLAVESLDTFNPTATPAELRQLAAAVRWKPRQQRRDDDKRRRNGLNENYARELLELHTLGVDGGYGQADVIEVARAFSGWSTFPEGPARQRLETLLADNPTAEAVGFWIEDEFLFRPDWHDAGDKAVLGLFLPAGRGQEDGEEVLDFLASHPSTAYHLARKLGLRFVSDQPSPAVVRRLAESYDETGGDLRELIRTLVYSPEFWQVGKAKKVKSPLELNLSALRALDAEVNDPRAVSEWTARMGQPLYACASPTGYPEKGTAWTHVGPLLSRINFVARLARGQIPGVTLDLLSLVPGAELSSLPEAMQEYFPLLLPGGAPGELEALLWGEESAVKEPEGEVLKTASEGDDGTLKPAAAATGEAIPRGEARRRARQAVTLLLASPMFQHR